ncbi:MAG: hypothetical protein KC925_02985 [Candidatus Doudnabacteria bacterium]|nr:hypothetical protein [Candidatus Doudnabacteria bacterium]MCA9387954.1 hypothetical protein [Candidatus Andersenbacteria bacterium]
MKRYLLGLGFSTVLCWGAFLLILTSVHPQSAGLGGLTGFYATLFFALLGTLTLLGYRLRRSVTRKNVVFAHLTPAFRQGALLALVLVAALMLQHARLLNLWNGAALVLAVLFLELFFQSRKGAAPTAQRA